MLRDLQQSQQKQFIEWSEHWHGAMLAQLDYHVLMEQRLDKLKGLWQGEGLAGASSTTPAAAETGDETPKEKKKKDREAESTKVDKPAAPAAAAPEKREPREKAPEPPTGEKKKKKKDAADVAADE